jgi:ParB family chromosome partitioning protein
MSSRNALGRGLGALLPTSPRNEPGAEAGDGAGPTRIPVGEIDPNPEQPRRRFDASNLAELADSITRHGVLQPIVVRRAGERFELIVGERRWRASIKAGQETIPAVVADVETKDRLELAIVENVQRHDLNPIELAYAYRALADAGATQEEIGKRVSKDRSSVANHLRLLELSVEVQTDVEDGTMTMGHAKALLQVSDLDARKRLRDRVIREELSVRATELAARVIAGPSARKPGVPGASAPPDPELQRLADVLGKHFQARVKLAGSQTRGRIEIEYTSDEDLDRISRLILEGF